MRARATARAGGAALLAALLCPLPGGPASAQQGGAVAAQMQALEEQVRTLNGRIEQLEYRLRAMSEDAARRINDLEYRLTLAEGGDASLVGDPVPLGETGGAPKGGQAVSVSERVAVEDARARLAQGDPDGAQRLLIAFLAQYPDGPLTAEAEHWLGVAQYDGGDPRSAAGTFLTNITAYPDGPRAADSLFMLGRALGDLGQRSEACATLAEVGRRHPGASAGAEAEAERTRLGCG